MVEFLVHDKREEDGQHFLTGVVNSGVVKNGHCFKIALAGSDSHEISMTVRQIKAYGQNLDDLPTGMTGELTIQGDGIEVIEHDVLLNTEC